MRGPRRRRRARGRALDLVQAFLADERGRRRAVDVLVVAARRLGRRREDRLGQLLRLGEPVGEPVAAHLAGRPVVLPARAGEVAAHDALDRQHLEPPALGRAAVGAQREQVVRDQLARAREPEPGEPGQDASLVRDLGGQDRRRTSRCGRWRRAAGARRRARRARAPCRLQGGLPQAWSGFLLAGRDGRDGRRRRRRERPSRRGRRRRSSEASSSRVVTSGSAADERGEVALLVPCLHGVALDEPVRLARGRGRSRRARAAAGARRRARARPRGCAPCGRGRRRARP